MSDSENNKIKEQENESTLPDKTDASEEEISNDCGRDVPRMLYLAAAVLCVIVLIICCVFFVLQSRGGDGSNVKESTEAETSEVETTKSETTALTETTAPPETTAIPETTSPPEASETTVPDTEPVLRYDYKLDNIYMYIYYMDTVDKQYLLLANRSSALGSGYVPKDLVSLKAPLSGKLRKNAAMALEAMVAEMKEYGINDVAVASSYRSYQKQKTLYEKYLAQERKRHPDYSESEIRALVDTYSARPGTSDHQTGLTVDFYPVDQSFEKTKVFKFLKEHGHKFGFILRFPEGKTDITGYMYEPWHWRFVGIEAASYIHENGITLEEYLGKA